MLKFLYSVIVTLVDSDDYADQAYFFRKKEDADIAFRGAKKLGLACSRRKVKAGAVFYFLSYSDDVGRTEKSGITAQELVREAAEVESDGGLKKYAEAALALPHGERPADYETEEIGLNYLRVYACYASELAK